MSSFNFKSAGFTYNDRLVSKEGVEVEIKPFGIKTPLEISKKSSKQLFGMNTNPLAQIKDNLKNLILTEKGERLGRPNFGCGLNNYKFDLSALPDFENVIFEEVESQVNLFMPFLQIVNIEKVQFGETPSQSLPSRDGKGLGVMVIRITFNVPLLLANNQKLEVVLLTGG